MLNDEKEPHIRRAVFLPMYYTVISLMVIKCFICRLNLYNPKFFRFLYLYGQPGESTLSQSDTGASFPTMRQGNKP